MSTNKDLPTYKRQRLLLAIADKLDEPASATDFQKLMFLFMMQYKRTDYEFVPYHYGPYSFQLAEDVAVLRKNGFLSDVTHRITLSRDLDLDGEIETDYSIPKERGDALMRRTYSAYPYYTINSEILNRLFGNKQKELQKLLDERERYKQDDEVLFTIGYEGRSLEAFVNTLIENDVRVLCDVRKNTYSRKFGFSREKLEQVMQGMKGIPIKYISISALGIESEKRKNLSGIEDYTSLFSDYEKTLPKLTKELDKLYRIIKAESRVALMCFEKDPQMCHRHVIRDYMCSKYTIRSADL